MKQIKVIVLLLQLTGLLFAQPKGKLLIIGGGTIPDYMISKYVELAGGANAKFAIVPMASGEPVQSANSFKQKLVKAGCTRIEVIFATQATADNDSNKAKIKNVKAVFFTGGDQSKLTGALQGTGLLEDIKKIYYSGGIVAGTSAGAAVMSSIMITGKELVNKDTSNAYNAVLKNNLETAKGFGFISNAIVDQHFLKRKRFQRLLSLVLENTNLPGIGIDESTGIIVSPDNTIEVIGESLVMIIDARNNSGVTIDKNNHPAAGNIKLTLLKNGDKFNLKKAN